MGFLDNLSDMFGNLKSGASDFLQGTTPLLASTPGAGGGAAYSPGTVADPFTGAAGQAGGYMGQIQTPPSFTDTGKTGGGLLDRLKTPDEQGLTIGDRLYAIGGVLQNDKDAGQYLQNQSQLSRAEAEKQRAQQVQQQSLDALRNNVDPTTGQLNVQGYLKALPAGGDLNQGFAVRKALQPEHSTLTPGEYGAIDVARDPNTGATTTTQIAAPHPKAGPLNADGTINMDYVRAMGLVAGAKSDATVDNQARIKGIFAPKTGGAGGGSLTGPQLKAAIAARRAALAAAGGG
jgi:hypothetical protein